MTQQQTADEAAHRQRYRLFLSLEGALLVVSGLACPLIFHGMNGWAQWPLFSLLYTLVLWHLVAIPICIFYLLGNPIVMSLSPLIPSAASMDLVRQLGERQALKDDEFYKLFYDDAGIPRDIPVRVRRCLAHTFPMMDRVWPTDLLYLLDDELDFADVLYVLGREFGIHFTRADYGSVDGTLGHLILMVDVRVTQFR
jgi:hypothetical protein